MKTIVIALLVSLILTMVCQKMFIPLLSRLKAGQTVLKYVAEHKDKNGTPTMGGLFFILPSALVFLIFGGAYGRIAVVSLTIGLAFMLVGFLDDFIKVKFKKNEGLRPYQKIIFQSSIAIFAGVFAYVNNITVFHVPFSNITVNLGEFTIIVVAVIFIAITNSVNLTDGLDGLAGGTCTVYLIFITILMALQISTHKTLYISPEEYEVVMLLSSCLIGGILGFLVFNVSKARVFMGDTGSLSLGGFIGSISVFSSNSFFIPIIGIMFVLSSISVIVQVLTYKKTKKRVFLMAPLHHHFQHKGYTETQIFFFYALVTCVMGIISLFSYM